MPNIDDYKTGQSFKIQLNGPHGTGKSIAAASFYKAGPLHILDFDGRFEPVAKFYQGKTKDISYSSYGSDNFKELIDWLDKVQNQPIPLTPEGRPFKTLVTDSITMCSMVSVLYQLDKKAKKRTTKAGLPATSWDEINGETVLISDMMEIMKNINRNHNINIIVCTHPITKTETIGNEDEGKSKKFESIIAYGNKVPSIVPGYFNEIYRLSVKKTGLNPVQYQRIATTMGLSPDGEIIAKSALGLPEEIDITNGLYDAITNHLNKK